MKFLVLLMGVLTLSPLVSADQYWRCDPLQAEYRLSDHQMYIMRRSYDYGKEHDLGYTLAAIAFKESSAGVRLYNWNDPSAGVHHVLATHVLNTLGMEHTPEHIEMGMEMLASNFYLSAHIALRELKWWIDRHNGDWFRAVRSYNQGHYWRLPEGERVRSYNYARSVQGIVRLMERESCWR